MPIRLALLELPLQLLSSFAVPDSSPVRVAVEELALVLFKINNNVQQLGQFLTIMSKGSGEHIPGIASRCIN